MALKGLEVVEVPESVVLFAFLLCLRWNHGSSWLLVKAHQIRDVSDLHLGFRLGLELRFIQLYHRLLWHRRGLSGFSHFQGRELHIIWICEFVKVTEAIVAR